MVRFLACSGVALALGGIWALNGLDPARRPERIAEVLRREDNQNARSQVVTLLAQAVRSDSANAYRLSDYGEALAAAGRVEEARQTFRRATDLAQGLPQIWFHAAVFHFQLGETALGLSSVRRILDEVPDYDATFFDYFDSLDLGPGRVLPDIEQNPRAARSYTKHLIAVNKVDWAQEAWHALLDRHFLDADVTALYISCLLRNHRYEAARHDWAASQEPSDYPNSNLVFNGGFERDLTRCPLDWEIQQSEQFDTARDDTVAYHGRWSIKIHFHGDGNVSYSNLVQTVRVHPGVHHLSAQIRTDGITTNEGIRLEILDPENPSRLDVRTGDITGSHDWTPIDQSFTVPQSTNIVAIRAVRAPSTKFDNAIGGSAWLDSVSLREGS